MDFSRYHTGYVTAPKAPPPKPLKVYARQPGQPLALFELADALIPQAIGMVVREGFPRALVLIQ